MQNSGTEISILATELVNTVTHFRVMVKHSEGVIKSCDTPDLFMISF